MSRRKKFEPKRNKLCAKRESYSSLKAKAAKSAILLLFNSFQKLLFSFSLFSFSLLFPFLCFKTQKKEGIEKSKNFLKKKVSFFCDLFHFFREFSSVFFRFGSFRFVLFFKNNNNCISYQGYCMVLPLTFFRKKGDSVEQNKNEKIGSKRIRKGNLFVKQIQLSSFFCNYR